MVGKHRVCVHVTNAAQWVSAGQTHECTFGPRLTNSLCPCFSQSRVRLIKGSNHFLARCRILCIRDFWGSGCEKLFFRSEEHTSELQSLMRISYAVFCLQ